jgi:hypothetical protein
MNNPAAPAEAFHNFNKGVVGRQTALCTLPVVRHTLDFGCVHAGSAGAQFASRAQVPDNQTAFGPWAARVYSSIVILLR